MMQLQDAGCILLVDFDNSFPKLLRLQQRCYSWINCPLMGLESPTYTMNMCGQMKILT